MSRGYCCAWRDGQLSRLSPPTTATAPAIAQNVLPVMDDPWMRRSPCPIHTAPVKTSKPPSTRRTIVTRALLERRVADDAARAVRARARRRRLGRGVAEHHLDHVDVLLVARDVAVAEVAAAEPAMQRCSRAELHPRELHELPRRE